MLILLDLPPEIVSLILIRLPVKTLSVLKCVSKFLSRVVYSPYFIREHLKFSTQDASMSSFKVMIRPNDNTHKRLSQTSVQSFCHESPVTFVNLDCPGIGFYETPRPVDSCNGLVLIFLNNAHMLIWNPTIRKHVKLPGIVGHMLLDRLPFFCCGFGFDASNDDYKVVALFALEWQKFKPEEFRYEVNVYSLKRNSWSRIPDFTPGGKFTDFSGTFESGKLHWCTLNGNIVSFDVEREVFGTLEHPKHAEGFSCEYCISSILGGSVTVCCHHLEHVDVWVRKEDGMAVSWTKMFTVNEYGDFYPDPYFILPNGEVLNDNDQVFAIYTPKAKSWRSTEIWFRYAPVIYVESLVSPC